MNYGLAYKSDFEHTRGYESITVVEISALEREYRRLRAKSIEIDQEYVAAVDAWEDARTQGFDDNSIEERKREMEAAWERVKVAEIEKSQAYQRMNCPHTHTKTDNDTPDGSPFTVCLICGAILE